MDNGHEDGGSAHIAASRRPVRKSSLRLTPAVADGLDGAPGAEYEPFTRLGQRQAAGRMHRR